MLAGVLLLAACTPPPTARPSDSTAVAVAPTLLVPSARDSAQSALPAQMDTPAPTPEPTLPPGKSVWVDPLLPADLFDGLRAEIGAIRQDATAADALVLSANPDALVKIGPAGPNDATLLVTRTLALAAPFPTVADGVAFDDLQRFWNGDSAALTTLTGQSPTPTLFMDADTRAAMVLLLGQPAITAPIVLLPPQDILSKTWELRPAALAIVPFERLDVRYKLLHIDGINLFERNADLTRYPLLLRVGMTGDPSTVARLRAAVKPRNNRDLEQMAVVAMTGVTALVRGTAVRMEEKGITYPAEAIRDWLSTADITHISNEVSFWENCRKPSRSDGVVMCSSPRYMELLEYIGTDVVELTGNHTWDYGADKLIPTIELYEKAGMKYFGGGRSLEDSRKPLLMTVRGNKIAFIGCNYFGANWASDIYAGSTPCGITNPQAFDWILPEIQRLKAEGYLVIATLQYTEFYTYAATRQQDIDFRRLRDAGAVVVNGSQGHHVQGFDVSEAGFCHYGTGNIFFGDQVFSEGAQQTMVDRHVFYQERYLGVDLRTAKIEDISRPVPMAPEKRAELLATLFKVSGY